MGNKRDPTIVYGSPLIREGASMRHHPIILLLCSLILLAGVQPVFAAAPRQSAAIQLTVEPFFDNYYRAGRWLPLRVTLTNNGNDVTAVVSVHTNASYETALELPRGAKKSVVLYIQPLGAFQQTETVRVMVAGAEVTSAEVALRGVASPRAFFALMTEQPLTLPLPTGEQAFNRIDVLPITRADLPERGEGLSMFDVLIVDGAPLADLSVAQQQALSDWVSMGGQLVIGGSKLEQVLGQLPDGLRPATFGAPAAPQPISLLPELEQAVPAAMTLTPEPSAVVLGRATDAPVTVQRQVGAGRVTLLGFSLSAPELAVLPAQSTLWSQIVRLPSVAQQVNGVPSIDEMRTQQFGMALMTLPVLAMPPLGILAGLLGLYVLIIGPGLYLILRRLDRQAWGWIAIPAVTLVFSLGTYGYGLRLRGNDIILNQLTVVEPSNGRSFVRSYAGIFSPRTTTYDIHTEQEALFRPLPAFNFAGVPMTSGNPNFVQGSAGIRALDVPQWSMSSFIAEQTIEGAPLTAELTLSGGVLRGTVRNTGPAIIRDLKLFQSTRVARIGDLQPGESRPLELELAADAPNAWDGPISTQLLRDKWDFNQPLMPPTDVRMQQMILDAMFGSAFDMPTQPTLVGWLDQAPIALTVERSRVQHQQNTIVALPVAVNYDPQTAFSLPTNWIKPSFEASSTTSGPCVSQFGGGWYVDTGIVTATLQLPPALNGRPLSQATVNVQTDGPPVTLKLDLLDRQAGEWLTQPEGERTMLLDDPGRYFGETGTLQLRIAPQANDGRGSGCISPTLTVEGAQP